ncbi:MAG: FAD-binding oxidoreductase [Symbiobacteriaceae bacterium]|nr:FAD-binding oxidoreductase [Symbiobacteriaceae bacterium]
MKQQAEVVIIGGGVVGCSIAYHLAQNGMKDVVLLERSYHASGSTGRCGAGVRQQWGTELNCRLAQGSCRDFETLREDLDYIADIEFKQGGYLLVAYTPQQVEQFKLNVALQNSLGIASRFCTPREAQEIVPHLNIEPLMAATFYHRDGHANPFHVTQAYADAAKRLGVEINLYTTVTAILTAKGKVTGVRTDQGDIACRVVVNAAGGQAKLIADMAGVEIPTISERHQILVTEPVDAFQGPMVMSFHHNTYCQQTPHGSFIMGLGDPREPQGQEIRSSWQFLKDMSDKITAMLPPLRNLRIVRQWAGLYHMTPDKSPILGSAPELEGFEMALGFSGHGFMISPMVARLMAAHILTLTHPDLDILQRLTVERFTRGDLIIEPSVV